MNVFLARHGQTEENLSRIFQGHLPGHLTEEGRRQAVALGESLKGIALDAIVSSDLQRVVDTVRLAVGDRGLPWEKNALFREIDWGSWTGLPIDSVDRSRLPADAETPEMLYARAGRCIEYLRAHYERNSADEKRISRSIGFMIIQLRFLICRNSKQFLSQPASRSVAAQSSSSPGSMGQQS